MLYFFGIKTNSKATSHIFLELTKNGLSRVNKNFVNRLRKEIRKSFEVKWFYKNFA